MIPYDPYEKHPPYIFNSKMIKKDIYTNKKCDMIFYYILKKTKKNFTFFRLVRLHKC